MDINAIIAISCIGITYFIGLNIAFKNLKMLKETKPQRVAARRAYKKVKNERLRIALGIPKREKHE